MNPHLHLGVVQSLRAEREAAARRQQMVNNAKHVRKLELRSRLVRSGQWPFTLLRRRAKLADGTAACHNLAA